jgi:nucleoside 2-deoxyribosyltransferase
VRTVYLIGSFRFYKDMLDVQKKLASAGVPCSIPQPSKFRDPEEPSRFLPSSQEQPRELLLKEAYESTVRCFSKIDKSDIVYVIDKGGYTGKSTLLDIGYAHAKKKPIYAPEEADDLAVLSLMKEVASPDKLIEIAKEG